MKQVAYYKGCLASLSAKELDSSTQALAKLSHGSHEDGHDPYGPGSFPKPWLPSEKKKRATDVKATQ